MKSVFKLRTYFACVHGDLKADYMKMNFSAKGDSSTDAGSSFDQTLVATCDKGFRAFEYQACCEYGLFVFAKCGKMRATYMRKIGRLNVYPFMDFFMGQSCRPNY